MSTIKGQQQQAGYLENSPERREQQVADIQLEIRRAFEVASTIEKALRIEGGESLPQFLIRVTNKLVESINLYIYQGAKYEYGKHCRSPSINVFISRFPDSSDASCLVVVDNIVYVRAKGFEPNVIAWVKAEGFESSSVASRVSACLAKSGFAIDDPGIKNGVVYTAYREIEDVSPELMADALHSVLNNAWGVARKEDIVCYFEYQNEHVFEDDEYMFRGRKLSGKQDLIFCLRQLLSQKPQLVSLGLVDQDRKSLLRVTRPSRESFALTLETWRLTDHQKQRAADIFEKATYTLDTAHTSPSSQETSWIGQHHPDNMEAVICKILAVLETDVESGDVYAQLHIPFV